MLKILKTIALWSAGGLVAFLAFGAFLTVFNRDTPSTSQAAAQPKLLDPWPFTVDYVTFKCRMPMGRGEGALMVIAPDGREFGLNGLGMSDRFPSPEPIWKESTEIAGTRVDIFPSLDVAASLCLADGKAAAPWKVTPETLKKSFQFNRLDPAN